MVDAAVLCAGGWPPWLGMGIRGAVAGLFATVVAAVLVGTWKGLDWDVIEEAATGL